MKNTMNTTMNLADVLIDAASDGNFSIVKYLVEKGVRDNDNSALIASAKNNDFEITKFFIEEKQQKRPLTGLTTIKNLRKCVL